MPAVCRWDVFIDIATCGVHVTKRQFGLSERVTECSHEFSALAGKLPRCRLAMVLRNGRVTGGQRRECGGELCETLEKLADLPSILDGVSGRSAGGFGLTGIRQHLCLPRQAAGPPHQIMGCFGIR